VIWLRMHWRDLAPVVGIVLVFLAFCAGLVDVWPILLRHLSLLSWIKFTFVHLGLLGSLVSLYLRSLKRQLIPQTEVALVWTLAVMTSGIDLSIISQIGERGDQQGAAGYWNKTGSTESAIA
jgi:hypothetical protein